MTTTNAEQPHWGTFGTPEDDLSSHASKPPTFTPEMRAAANEKRRQRTASLRSDFPSEDEAEWSALAAAAGIKLPPYGVPCMTGRMSDWLARLGIPLGAYLDWMGVGIDGTERSAKLADFAARNPRWPLKAWLGLVLEHRDLILRLAGLGREVNAEHN